MSWPTPIRIVGAGTPQGDDVIGWESARRLRAFPLDATIHVVDGGQRLLTMATGCRTNPCDRASGRGTRGATRGDDLLKIFEQAENFVMFKRILIPVDLTSRHQRVLETAAELARQSDGEVILVHVIEVVPGLSVEEDPTFYNKLEQLANQHMNRLGQGLRNLHISVQTRCIFGNRAQQVAETATETKADLIIVSSPRFNPSKPATGFASLSWKIEILAPCPVLLVKHD
jgi:nucleotide-binding universal stress UspA family protein